MRRLLVWTIIALLLGIAINVGLAWSIALWGAARPGEAVHGAEHDEAAGTSWIVTVREARGISLVYELHHRGRLRDPVLAQTPPSTILPSTLPLPDRPSIGDKVPGERLDDERRRPEERGTLRATMVTGWPQPALRCAYQGKGAIVGSSQETFWDTDVAGGIPIGGGARRDCGMHLRRALPLRPVWRGFAVNTLVFMGCLLPFLLGATVMRERTTRLKRGRCPDCNHPIRGRPSCVNCGRPLPRVDPARPRRSPIGDDLGARRRAKRVAGAAVVALGLGVATNAAVSWTSACLPRGKGERMSQGSETFHRWFAERPSRFPDKLLEFGRSRTFGGTWTCGVALGSRRDIVPRRTRVWDGERWIDWDAVEPEVCEELRNRAYHHTLVEAGWPFPAFRGSAWKIERLVPPPPGVANPGRLITEDRSGALEIRIRDRTCLVPIVPAWRGFALNAVIFAPVWAVLLPLPLRLRRVLRRRTGRCPRCAYPAGNESTCTECGERLPTFDVPALVPVQ